jgi:hypothetical protein
MLIPKFHKVGIKRPLPDKGVFANPTGLIHDVCQAAPIGCPDACLGEITKALYAIAKEAGVKVGRGCGYDQLKDIYVIVGKSLTTGKAQDFSVQGEEVAALIQLARILAGGRLEVDKITKQITPNY